MLAAGGIVLLFRLVRPERLARPEGFRSLVEFVTVLRTPTSPFLPSEWVQRAIMAWLQERPDLLPVYLLWSTAAAAFVLGALLHRRLYADRIQQGAGERRATGARRDDAADRARDLLAPLGDRAARAGAEGAAAVLPRHDAVVAAHPARPCS